MIKYLERTIHASADADFDNFAYTKVYASSAATPTINGTEVPMIAGGQINVLVQSISSTANVFVLGKRNLSNPTYING